MFSKLADIAEPETLVRRIASAGTLISSLEMLSQAHRFDQGELLSTQFHNHSPKLAERFPRLTQALASKGAAICLYGIQAAASTATIIWPRSRPVQLAAGVVLAGSVALDRIRTPFGGDGADELQNVINVTLASTALFTNREQARDVAMRALALETTISYVASGLVKLISPVWLKGEAFSGIIRTTNYGDQRLFALVSKYPVLGKLVSWATIAVEVGFPLVFVLPKPASKAYVGVMFGFHLGIGQFMGLNRFVAAFSATHPALLYVIGQRGQRSLSRG